MSNTYGNLPEFKSRMGISGTADDTDLLETLIWASREIDRRTHRQFYVSSGASRFFDTEGIDRLYFDDLLVATTITADSELDETYDGETWVAGTDHNLIPRQGFPKLGLQLTADSGKRIPRLTRSYFKIIGDFGYGDGVRAAPVDAQGGTYTVADGTGLVITIDSGTDPVPGETLLIESEQLFVESVTAATSFATPRRGENGTTGAAHTAKTANVYRYPPPIVRACYLIARDFWRARQTGDLIQERFGDYSYKRAASAESGDIYDNVLAAFILRNLSGVEA